MKEWNPEMGVVKFSTIIWLVFSFNLLTVEKQNSNLMNADAGSYKLHMTAESVS
jgi:hypothetical protein